MRSALSLTIGVIAPGVGMDQAKSAARMKQRLGRQRQRRRHHGFASSVACTLGWPTALAELYTT
eukprot:8152357-Alexandrium_andersonii.AAC.1